MIEERLVPARGAAEIPEARPDDNLVGKEQEKEEGFFVVLAVERDAAFLYVGGFTDEPVVRDEGLKDLFDLRLRDASGLSDELDGEQRLRPGTDEEEELEGVPVCQKAEQLRVGLEIVKEKVEKPSSGVGIMAIIWAVSKAMA